LDLRIDPPNYFLMGLPFSFGVFKFDESIPKVPIANR